ncbi:MAG: hypothetical protein O3C67_04700 [Cyanobacteria bacterium]|nr:hypothetical protein [Cyanobacteriota bacterium]
MGLQSLHLCPSGVVVEPGKEVNHGGRTMAAIAPWGGAWLKRTTERFCTWRF